MGMIVGDGFVDFVRWWVGVEVRVIRRTYGDVLRGRTRDILKYLGRYSTTKW